jgi:hypothetical protein
MGCLISVSSEPIARLGDKKYYDLVGTVGVLRSVFSNEVVDGFELQLEPEWDSEGPSLTDGNFADWTETPKYTAEEVVALFENKALPILSVHASQDMGSHLCSRQENGLERGKRTIHDALFIADRLKAEVAVFHLWDTWVTSFDLDRLRTVLRVFP